MTSMCVASVDNSANKSGEFELWCFTAGTISRPPPTYLPTYLPACTLSHIAALTLDQILILHCLFFVYKQANTQTNTHTDKVVVGSFQGMLRVYSPASESFSPHHLSLEKKTSPILQVAVGRFDLLRAYVLRTLPQSHVWLVAYCTQTQDDTVYFSNTRWMYLLFR